MRKMISLILVILIFGITTDINAFSKRIDRTLALLNDFSNGVSFTLTVYRLLGIKCDVWFLPAFKVYCRIQAGDFGNI